MSTLCKLTSRHVHAAHVQAVRVQGTFYERLNSDRPTASVVPVLKPIHCDFTRQTSFISSTPFILWYLWIVLCNLRNGAWINSSRRPCRHILKRRPVDGDPHPFWPLLILVRHSVGMNNATRYLTLVFSSNNFSWFLFTCLEIIFKFLRIFYELADNSGALLVSMVPALLRCQWHQWSMQ
jgi:hypothetical protein